MRNPLSSIGRWEGILNDESEPEDLPYELVSVAFGRKAKVHKCFLFLPKKEEVWKVNFCIPSESCVFYLFIKYSKKS